MFTRANSASLAKLEVSLALTAGILLWAELSFPGLALCLLLGAIVSRTLRAGWTWKMDLQAWLLALFWCTALVGLSISPTPGVAWHKFQLITVSAAVFVLIAMQIEASVWDIFLILGAGASAVSVYFFLTDGWALSSTDVGWVGDVGQAWIQIRPAPIGTAQHPNVVGGLLAVLLPIMGALSFRNWEVKTGLWRATPAVLTAFLIFALLMTSSRAAWVALGVSSLAWVWLRAGKRLARGSGRVRAAIYSLPPVLTAVAIGLTDRDSILALVRLLPGPDHTLIRLALYEQTLNLIRDVPFTGGGLASFPALYAHYIYATPFLLFDYSHNLYLDVALEQGPVALFLLLALLFSSALSALRKPALRESPKREGWARVAVGISLGVVLLHGLVDDSLYGRQSTPFLFVVPALASCLQMTDGIQPSARSQWLRPMARLSAASLIFLALFAVFDNRDRLLSRLHSNLGALAMARVELANWPSNRWNDLLPTRRLADIEDRFRRSLDRDYGNTSALHRLGLIAMNDRNHASAINFLKRAHDANPGHRGIVKSLAYSYVWHGNLERARQLLSGIPEAADEMDAYSFWWAEQGAPDLARRARQMAEELNF